MDNKVLTACVTVSQRPLIDQHLIGMVVANRGLMGEGLMDGARLGERQLAASEEVQD